MIETNPTQPFTATPPETTASKNGAAMLNGSYGREAIGAGLR